MAVVDPARGRPGTGRGQDFSGIRAEFRLPSDFPTAVLVEAEQAVSASLGEREDATDLPLVTIDPPGAKDLDQAMLLRRRRTGYRLDYAIADPGHFIRPGGALDQESRRRGQTLYLPDELVPLHPPQLSEDAASLLPDEVRPAVLWTIDCDAYGALDRVHVRRALVRSVAQLDYDTVRDRLSYGTPHHSYALLPELGRLRRELAVSRGAVELQLPEQQAVADGNGGWRLVLRSRVDVEAWNAEMSLLTGMAAANLMLGAGVGVLRTLPDPDPEAMDSLRRRASALGVDWPAGTTAASVLARLDPSRPEALAFHVDATRLLRGAGYSVLDAKAGLYADTTTHAGLGAAYAHVTAPIRRLVDRFGAEVCLAIAAGVDVPAWVCEALPELPALMAASDTVASRVERACLSQVEAWVLADRVGETFPAVVLHAEARGGEVFVAEPPVVSRCVGDDLPEGERIDVRLVEADVARRKVTFEPARQRSGPVALAEPTRASEPARGAERARVSDPGGNGEPTRASEPARGREPARPPKAARPAEPALPSEAAPGSEPARRSEAARVSEPARGSEPARPPEAARGYEAARPSEAGRRSEAALPSALAPSSELSSSPESASPCD